jgi:hypothetical protein
LKAFKKCVIAVVAGGVGGVFILGLGGRIAMALIALHYGTDVNLSFRGVFEVLSIAFVIGIAGGLLLLPLRLLFPTRRLVRSTIMGALLFSGSLFISWATGRLSFDSHAVLPTALTAVAIIYGLYGLTTDALLTRFEGSR